MSETRQIQNVRFGIKHGPRTAFISPRDHNQCNPFMSWDHFEASKITAKRPLQYHGYSGVETLCYPVSGSLLQNDSIGSRILRSGDINVMNSGSGMIQRNTLLPHNGHIETFSLWTALPAGKEEMANAASQSFPTQSLPLVEEKDSTTKVLLGNYHAATSPGSCRTPVTLLDIIISPYGNWHFAPPENLTHGFIYIRSGSVYISGHQLHPSQMATLKPSHLEILLKTGKIGARLFVALGKPLQQPFFTNRNSVHSSPENESKSTQNIMQLLAKRP
ncbi:pirin [Photobacterium aquae]|uniref:Pirin n=2 Tax=Photobacterium aquae TaxID=1195763 RepID=A0A0J1HCB7_9GAMM|nr:pirin [Photobacterium aquae]